MKMPIKIDAGMIAPCGMNCLVCYKHCYHKKPCAGCRKSGAGKPQHCQSCRIKGCVKDRNMDYCYVCPEYPCKQIKNLEKSYKTRYHASLTENSRMIKEQGIAVFLNQQREIYTCPQCGGIISIHDAECSECRYRAQQETVCDLRKIPGVGTNIERALKNIGISCVEDLKGKDPEELYRLDCLKKGFQEDRCQLYVFRCAVYYAEHEECEAEKLKWWYWKDKEYPGERG